MSQKEGAGTELSAEEIARQASKADEDDIYRRVRRGDETKGDPDKRDVAGAIDFEDTPRGREERKHEVEEAAEHNEET